MQENKQMEKIKDLIRKELHLEKDQEVHVEETTDKVPYKIQGLQYFRSSYQFNKDPVPMQYWVFVDSTKLYRGDWMLTILEKRKIVPTSEEEALLLAHLIVFAQDNWDQILPIKDSASSLGKAEPPKVVLKNGVYEITFSIFRSSNRVSPVRKYILSLGQGVYKKELLVK